jgi:hypothetical protein
VGKDEIHLPFDEDGITEAADFAFGFIEAEENLGFGKNGRFGTVQIFGGLAVIFEDPSGESDDSTAGVGYGENDPSAETVIEI